MTNNDFEETILAAFLFAEDYGDSWNIEPFELDPDIFSTEFKKRIARQINDVTNKNGSYSYLMAQLEAKVEGSKYEFQSPFYRVYL